jgi:hypothetical protein
MLKYHQATYDLLTKEYIDPKPAIDAFEKSAPYQNQMYKQQGQGEDVARQKLEDERNDTLAWTKLDLYQRPVTFSQSNIEKLDALEAKYQVKLPEAVREWYSLDILPAVMALSHGSYISPKPIEEFSPAKAEKNRPDLWYFYFAEYIDQGGDSIYFQMDQGDNPPVYAEYGKDYRLLKPSFSEFIYRHFWLFQTHYCFPYYVHIWSNNAFKSKMNPSRYWISLTDMAKLFTPSSSGKYHFYDEHSRILGSAQGEVVNSMIETVNPDFLAGGSFHTKTPETLKNLILHLWGNDGPVFHMETSNPELDPMLKELKQEKLKRLFQSSNDWLSQAELAKKLNLLSPRPIGELYDVLNNLLNLGEIEAHPDNEAKSNPENRYRLKPITNNE